MGEGNGGKNKTSIDMINASHKSEDILSLIDNSWFYVKYKRKFKRIVFFDDIRTSLR